jgi:hypothetical protein
MLPVSAEAIAWATAGSARTGSRRLHAARRLTEWITGQGHVLQPPLGAEDPRPSPCQFDRAQMDTVP